MNTDADFAETSLALAPFRPLRPRLVLAPRRGQAAALLLALLCACGDRPARESAAEPTAQPPAAPAQAEPFVVFTASTLVIDRLDSPVAAPVTVGSSPSILTSSAPDVVSVDATGSLVGHRSGKALVRTADGRASLEVEVKAVSAFAVVPARLALRPGGKGRLRLVAAGSGEELSASAAQWASDAPEVALVFGGEVEAGARPGTSNVLVTYGGQSARAVVVVGQRQAMGGGNAAQSRTQGR